MEVGVGLPIGDPAALLDWARRVEAGPFSTVGLLDRLVYDNPEPLVALAAVAGVTSRIRVQTEVLLAPLREPALLAKQSATLDRMSGGRFTLGLGLGGRQDDYLAAGADIRRRGRRLDEQLASIRRIWSGEPAHDGMAPIGPAPMRSRGPEMLFGAFAPAALERVARWGDGLITAAPVERCDPLFRAVEQSWDAAGRDGRPRFVAQVNVAIGGWDVLDEARDRIRSYYGFTGYPERIVQGVLSTPEQIRDAMCAFDKIGADEIVFYCWSSEMDQVDRLADYII